MLFNTIFTIRRCQLIIFLVVGTVSGLQLQFNKSDETNPIIDDMKLNQEQWKMLKANIKVFGRNGVMERQLRWPNGNVRYIFARNVDIKTRDLLIRAFHHISSKSCVRFVESTEEVEDVLEIVWGDICYSWVGYQPYKRQKLMVSPSCSTIGTVAHELMHTLGFFHMHSSPDRDLFVEIRYENIFNDKFNQFHKLPRDFIYHFGVSYDFNSIMHYPRQAYSKNGYDTIVPRIPSMHIGQRLALSDSDFLKLNRMYECENFI